MIIDFYAMLKVSGPVGMDLFRVANSKFCLALRPPVSDGLQIPFLRPIRKRRSGVATKRAAVQKSGITIRLSGQEYQAPEAKPISALERLGLDLTELWHGVRSGP